MASFTCFPAASLKRATRLAFPRRAAAARRAGDSVALPAQPCTAATGQRTVTATAPCGDIRGARGAVTAGSAASSSGLSGCPLDSVQPACGAGGVVPVGASTIAGRNAIACADFSPGPEAVNARAPVAPGEGWEKSPAVIPTFGSVGAERTVTLASGVTAPLEARAIAATTTPPGRLVVTLG